MPSTHLFEAMNESYIIRENPAFPSQIVGQVKAAHVAEIDQVVVTANESQDAWERETISMRCRHLIAALDALTAAECEHIATTLCLELGKPIAACRSELGAAIRVIRHFTEIAPELLRCREFDDERGCVLINKIPFGVIGAIIPWNAPLFVASLKLAPALLAGNTFVLKASPLAPLAVSLLIDCLCSQLPNGVLQLVQGNASTGKALVQHRLIRKLSFTGGAAVAREIQAVSSNLVRPFVMELGGNDAALLLEDADFSETDYEQLVHASFSASGQSCIGCKRIYVPRKKLNNFVDDFCRVSDRVLRLGDPLQPDVSVGPVVSREAQQRLERLTSMITAHSEVKLMRVGQISDPDIISNGYYVHPSVVVGLSPQSPLVCDEQFGPLIPILPYDSLEEAIAAVNSTDFGLGGSVWSSDVNHAFAIASRFKSGVVFVNSHGRLGQMPHAPFGGLKESGYGRESGDAGLLEYVQDQSVFLPSSAKR